MSEEAGISYWPEGWDRERLLNAEATGELEQISQDQMFKIRRGLVQELGEDGFSDFLAEMEKRTKQGALFLLSLYLDLRGFKLKTITT